MPDAKAKYPIIMAAGDPDWVRALSVSFAVVRRHNSQALINHGGQSVDRLAERGGLHIFELLAILEDQTYSAMPMELARLRIAACLDKETQRHGE